MANLQTVITPKDNCSPVWQYLLIMGNDLAGQAEQIKALAGAMQTVAGFWDEKTQERAAKFFDEAVSANAGLIEKMRGLIEESTGWKD